MRLFSTPSENFLPRHILRIYQSEQYYHIEEELGDLPVEKPVDRDLGLDHEPTEGLSAEFVMTKRRE